MNKIKIEDIIDEKSIEDAVYWKYRCYVAESLVRSLTIEGTPKEVILSNQKKHEEVKDIIEPSKRSLYIDEDYLLKTHPELSKTEARDFKEFLKKKTIALKGCYEASKFYPQWVDSKK